MKWLRSIVNGVLIGLMVVVLMIARPADAGHLRMVPNHDRAERLLKVHHCWQHDAPADVEIPGHVVLDLPAGRTVYGGPKLTGRALDQQFDGKDHGFRIWGFCR